MLLDLAPQRGSFAPLVIDQNGLLIDGYRRWQLALGDQVDAVEMQTGNLFDSAFELNLHSRVWDSIDRFLWLRWAESMKTKTDRIKASFPEVLAQTPRDMLKTLAARKLQLRQLQLILEAPDRLRQSLHTLLTERIELNPNETARLIEMVCDLLSRFRKRSMQSLFDEPVFAEVLGNPALTPKQKGEALLKAIRILRYPEYQKRLKEVSFLAFELERFATMRKSEFVERGVLEITIRADCIERMDENLSNARLILVSPEWNKIWEDI
jgi:hypothetical protein